MPSGISRLRLWQEITRKSDNEKTDNPVGKGTGGEFKIRKRKIAGV